jgi:hypothetical protein
MRLWCLRLVIEHHVAALRRLLPSVNALGVSTELRLTGSGGSTGKKRLIDGAVAVGTRLGQRHRQFLECFSIGFGGFRIG